MRSSILCVATFVAACFAAPHHRGPVLARDVVVYDIKTVTNIVYVTEYGVTSTHSKTRAPKVKTTAHPPPPPPAPTTTPLPVYTPPPPPPPAPVAPAPEVQVVTYEPPAPESTPVYVAPASNSPANDGSPTSGGVSILSTCNKFRDLYNFPHFEWSSKLATNAAQTGEADGGKNEEHHLYDGSMGQVITPGLKSSVSGVNLGGDSPFEIAYLAWMCENSSDSQISSLCPTMMSAMNMVYSGNGHWEILTSTSYTTIGCAFTEDPSADPSSPYQGLWICDVGF